MATCYILAFVSSGLISLFVTPLVVSLAKKYGALDRPGGRKIHSKTVPSWGGLSIYIAFICSLGILYLLKNRSFHTLLDFPLVSWKIIDPPPTIGTYLIGIIYGATIILILGLIDDKKPLPAITKLAFQIIASLVVLEYGIKMFGFKNPFSGQYIKFPIILSIIVTVVWILGFINSVNLIDALDGLAAGIVAICGIIFFIVSILQIPQQTNLLVVKSLKLTAILSCTLAGGTLGFLRHNFNPAKIFMGDTGSMFLGFILGTITIIGTLKTTAAIALFIPIIVIGLPFFEVLTTIIRRISSGKSVMRADSLHLPQWLLSQGVSHRKIVIWMYIISIILGGGAVLLVILKG